MLRRLAVLSLFVWFCSAAVYCQDEPSLGDVARQTRSQKNGDQSKKVITNEDLGSTPATGASGPGASADPASLTKPGSGTSPEAALQRAESAVKFVESLDRATLVNLALEGDQTNFPGRAEWENRMVAARETYVARLRDLLQRGKQLLAAAQALDAAHADSHDPRVKALTSQMSGFVGECVRTDAAFQSVIMEGKDLAHRASNSGRNF